MTIDNQKEPCSEKKSAIAARNRTFVTLQQCCKTMSANLNILAPRIVDLANVQQWLKQLPPNERQLIIEAWNAWICATARYQCVKFENRMRLRYTDNASWFRTFTAGIFVCALALSIDSSRPHAVSTAVLMSLGVAAATWIAYGVGSRSNQPGDSIVRARLKARAVAWHVAGWQLNSTGNAFLGELYPWKYDPLGLRLYAPRIRLRLSR